MVFYNRGVSTSDVGASASLSGSDVAPSASVEVVHDHCYQFQCPSGQCQQHLQEMKEETQDLKSKIVDLQMSMTALQKKQHFRLSDILADNEKVTV